jgi:hypothetical protein
LARLGVGNQVVIDAQFSSGKLLRSPTRDQIPDTLRIPMDQVEELRAPGGLSEGAKKGAAVGVRLDTLFVITLITALAWMVTALGNLPKQ